MNSARRSTLLRIETICLAMLIVLQFVHTIGFFASSIF